MSNTTSHIALNTQIVELTSADLTANRNFWGSFYSHIYAGLNDGLADIAYVSTDACEQADIVQAQLMPLIQAQDMADLNNPVWSLQDYRHFALDMRNLSELLVKIVREAVKLQQLLHPHNHAYIACGNMQGNFTDAQPLRLLSWSPQDVADFTAVYDKLAHSLVAALQPLFAGAKQHKSYNTFLHTSRMQAIISDIIDPLDAYRNLLNKTEWNYLDIRHFASLMHTRADEIVSLIRHAVYLQHEIYEQSNTLPPVREDGWSDKDVIDIGI